MSTTRKPAAKTTTRKPRTTKAKVEETEATPEVPVEEDSPPVQVLSGESVLVDVPIDAPVDDAADKFARTRAAFEKHGIAAEGIPSRNAIFDQGYIRIRGNEELGFGMVTEFNQWPSREAHDEVLAAYLEDSK